MGKLPFYAIFIGKHKGNLQLNSGFLDALFSDKLYGGSTEELIIDLLVYPYCQ